MISIPVRSSILHQTKTYKMKKTVLKNGIIGGLLLTLFMVVTFNTNIRDLSTPAKMAIGYLGMLVAFIFIFVGVRQYREQNDGAISFGKAFQVGFLIMLIASTFYVATWMIEQHFFIPEYFEKFTESYLNELQQGGASPTELEAARSEMAHYAELYKNPIYVALFTYMEILPVGLIMSLLAAAILRKKPVVAL